MAYGVTPAGFARKPLETMLAEIEEGARGVFGADVIQSAASPLGQLNGLCASLVTTLWEVAEDAYQSYDPDQAEVVRLEQLGRLRLLERVAGELDPEYRRAITNADRARIDLPDIERAIADVAGVTWVRVYANARCITVPGLPARAVAAAVIGGDDGDVAATFRPYVVPGIDAYGNRHVSLVVDGYCRAVALVRPALVPVGLRLVVRVQPDALGCPPSSAIAIAEAAANGLSGADRLANGQDLTLHRLRTAVSRAFANVEVVSAEARTGEAAFAPLPFVATFLEMVTVSADDVAVGFA